MSSDAAVMINSLTYYAFRPRLYLPHRGLEIGGRDPELDIPAGRPLLHLRTRVLYRDKKMYLIVRLYAEQVEGYGELDDLVGGNRVDRRDLATGAVIAAGERCTDPPLLRDNPYFHVKAF